LFNGGHTKAWTGGVHEIAHDRFEKDEILDVVFHAILSLVIAPPDYMQNLSSRLHGANLTYEFA
jgi:hypothetical protein